MFGGWGILNQNKWLFYENFAVMHHHHNQYNTHCPPVTRNCIGKLGHHWLREWSVAYSTPSLYLNLCWSVVNWTLRREHLWNLYQITKIWLKGIHQKCCQQNIHWIIGNELRSPALLPDPAIFKWDAVVMEKPELNSFRMPKCVSQMYRKDIRSQW